MEQLLVVNERRAYNLEEIQNRKQTEPSWRDFGPRTILPGKKIDSQGKIISGKKGLLLSRLSKIQRSLINSLERNLWEAQPKLKLYSSKLNIPEYVRETAWKIYVEVAKEKLTMGRSIDGFIAAALYAAIRIHEFPKLFEDVIEASMVSKRTAFRSLGMIIRVVLPRLNYQYHPVSTEKLIYFFGNKLELPAEMQMEALSILKKASKKGLGHIGKDPKGLAAAVLYLVAKKTDLRKTQNEVAQVAKITEVTLRSRLKDIKTIFYE